MTFHNTKLALWGGGSTLDYHTDFENDGYLALTLEAKIPFVGISVSFPQYNETQESLREVRQQIVEGIEGDVFYQSKITSTLQIDYDVNVSLSFKELIARFYEPTLVSRQSDFGMGVGVLGLEVRDSVSHDLRFRTDPMQSFVDSAVMDTINSSNKQSFTAFYISAYYDFLISDDITTGLAIKWYADDNKNEDRLSVDGYTLSLYVNYFPKFSW